VDTAASLLILGRSCINCVLVIDRWGLRLLLLVLYLYTVTSIN
jgi:hypothetical protein